MAMQLSRARSSTISATSPVTTSPPQTRASIEHDEPAFPIPSLSRQEEHDLEFARGVRPDIDTEEPTETFHTGPAPEAHLNHLSAGHDPALLVSLAGPEPDEIGGLPMYQANAPFQEQAPFDFTALEAFAREEKKSLGIVSPTTPSPPDGGIPSSQTTTSTVPPLPEFNANGGNDFTAPFTMPRTRQRKLSQSVGPRRGKMALFEHPSGGPPPSLAFRSPQLATGAGTLSVVPSYDNLPDTNGPTITRQATMGMGSGHDRPYRFSFYSNALNVTIHARSLSELPAEGQTFEELFLGVNGKDERPDGVNTSRPGTSMGLGGGGPRGMPPIPIAERSGISKMSAAKDNGTNAANGKPVEASTWWLDVLSPTDEEMKLLSKVRLRARRTLICCLHVPFARSFPSIPLLRKISRWKKRARR